MYVWAYPIGQDVSELFFVIYNNLLYLIKKGFKIGAEKGIEALELLNRTEIRKSWYYR